MKRCYDFVKSVSGKKVDFQKISNSRNGENTTRLINYLKNSKDVYPILDMEKEQELIKQHKNDRETLNKLLFMHNVRLVFDICLKYFFKTADFDDMVGRAFVGLAEAADRFDLKKKRKFSTYATWWIYKYVLQEFQTKEIKKNIKILSLNNDVDTSISGNTSDEFEDYLNPNSLSLSSYFQTSNKYSNPIERIQEDELKSITNEIYDYVNNNQTLSCDEINIFNKIFVDGEKVKSISEETGLSVFRVKQAKDKVLKSIKTMLKEKYNLVNIGGLIEETA